MKEHGQGLLRGSGTAEADMLLARDTLGDDLPVPGEPYRR